MGLTGTLARADFGPSATYLFEGGMVRDHATQVVKTLTRKIRIACLFTGRVLVHPGNIFEEGQMFEALVKNADLLAAGNVLPVFRGGPATLEGYAGKWEEAFRNQNVSNPAFYQSQPLTSDHLKAIGDRADFFRSHEYQALILESPDQSGLKLRFLNNLFQILVEEMEFDDAIKDAIWENAQGGSPLGRINVAVIQNLCSDPKKRDAAGKLARRINVSFFAAGAHDLGTWFSMNEAALGDLTAPGVVTRASLSNLIELQIDRQIAEQSDALTAIDGGDYAELVNSADAARFRRAVGRVIDKLHEQLAHGAGLQEITATGEAGRHQLFQDFCDTYSGVLAKLLKKQRSIEARRTKMISAGLIGTGVLTDLLLADAPVPAGTGTAIGWGVQELASRMIKPRLAPIIVLQERLRNAGEKA